MNPIQQPHYRNSGRPFLFNQFFPKIEICKLAKTRIIDILNSRVIDVSLMMNIGALNLKQSSVSPALASSSDRKTGSQEPSKNEPQEVVRDKAELKEISELKARDREVRAHEAAHIAAGDSVVRGGARLTYVRGPDGVLYATGGEVSIDTSGASTPEATLAKAERIRRAALAPAKPSSQDRAVAAQAARMAMQARQEILAQQNAQEQIGPSISKAINSYQSASTLEEPSSADIDELI